jgi:hypothetical protein
MEEIRRSTSEIEKYIALTEQQMVYRARAPGLLAWVCTGSGKKLIEFENRDDNAVFIIRICAVLNTTHPELTRAKCVGQPLRLEVHREKLKTIAGSQSKRLGSACE